MDNASTRKSQSAISRARKTRRESLLALCFVAPWIVGFVLFLAYPLALSFYLSLTDYELYRAPRYVGLENYRYMMARDGLYWRVVSNTGLYAVLSVPLVLLIGLGAALLLNQPVKGRSFWRTLYFLPALVPPVATIMVFRALFDPGTGLVNRALGALGLPQPGWFASSDTAVFTLVLVSGWGFGSAMVILLAGLQGVPRSLYEAASLDGAKPWTLFRHVTLPMISPALFFNFILGCIGAFQIFAQSLLVGGLVGWPGGSTLFYNVYLYATAFQPPFRLGYGAALGWVLFVGILLLTGLNFLLSRRLVFYGDEK